MCRGLGDSFEEKMFVSGGEGMAFVYEDEFDSRRHSFGDAAKTSATFSVTKKVQQFCELDLQLGFTELRVNAIKEASKSKQISSVKVVAREAADRELELEIKVGASDTSFVSFENRVHGFNLVVDLEHSCGNAPNIVHNGIEVGTNERDLRSFEEDDAQCDRCLNYVFKVSKAYAHPTSSFE